MIFNSTKGSNIGAAIDYVRGPGRDQVQDRATLLGGSGFGFEPSDERTADIAKRLMIQNGSKEFQGEKDKYCTKDCLHFSLSWHPDQAPPDLEEKRETARKFLKALGMENSMHLVYDHADKRHPHIHIVASRIDPETRMAYDDYWRVKKGIQCALEKEREDELKGLRPIPEAKRQLHAECEVNQERRLEAIQKLYAARKQEQAQRYLAKQAVNGLYRAHEKEKERRMDDDGPKAQMVMVPRAKERAVAQDNDKWMKPLIEQWQKNREAAKIEPKRSIVDRIIERAPQMEKTKEIGREREL